MENTTGIILLGAIALVVFLGIPALIIYCAYIQVTGITKLVKSAWKEDEKK